MLTELRARGQLLAPRLQPRGVALLSLDPDSIHASGATLNALAESLGRRARRKVRRILGEIGRAQIEAFDFKTWRDELRRLATSDWHQAVDMAGVLTPDSLQHEQAMAACAAGKQSQKPPPGATGIASWGVRQTPPRHLRCAARRRSLTDFGAWAETRLR